MNKMLMNGKPVVKERENGHRSSPTTSKASDTENGEEKFTAKGINNDEKSDDDAEEEEEESLHQDPNMSVMEGDSSFNNTHDSGLGTEAERAMNTEELSQDSGHGGEGNAEVVAECSQKSKIDPVCLSRKVQVLGGSG